MFGLKYIRINWWTALISKINCNANSKQTHVSAWFEFKNMGSTPNIYSRLNRYMKICPTQRPRRRRWDFPTETL